MIHHDRKDYAVAASEAARHGRIKMEEVIHRGQANAKAVVDAVLAKTITDKIVRTPAVRVMTHESGNGWLVDLPDNGGRLAMHPHAWGQMVADAGMPKRYADELVSQANGTPWGSQLVAYNINEIFKHRAKQRNLVRAEGGGIVKGWLSDKYRRIDSRPLIDTFMGACNTMGLLPIEGIGTDTKTRLRVVLPEVFEPIPNEVMLFGLEWGNSDYGDGGHVLNLWTMRVYCTNLAIGQQMIRQIHLGKRLDDNIEYSQRTYELDTATNVSALKDTVGDAIGPKRVNAMIEGIKQAAEQVVKGDVADVLKKFFDKDVAEKVRAMYDGPDVQNMPAGKTLWRLSNAASFFAQTEGLSADRKLELQAAAGQIAKLREGREQGIAV